MLDGSPSPPSHITTMPPCSAMLIVTMAFDYNVARTPSLLYSLSRDHQGLTGFINLFATTV
jgi:hypothetical protein